MVSQSWDGSRVYLHFLPARATGTSAKPPPKARTSHYFKAYDWADGKLDQKFAIDFHAEKLGKPHQMRFGAYALYGMTHPTLDRQVARVETN